VSTFQPGPRVRVRPAMDPPRPAHGDIPVIVTGGEHISGLAAVRALHAAGYAPWVAVHGEGTYAGRSRRRAGLLRVPDPAHDRVGFVRALAAGAREIGAVAIVPGTETAMLALAEQRDLIPAGVAVGADPGAVANATDKRRLEGFARAAGLTVPPSIEVDLPGSPGALPFPYPVVVKPRTSELRGANGAIRHYGARKVHGPDGLPAALDALPGGAALIQPFLAGPLTSLAGVFWDGRLLCAVQSRSDRIWPTECGSISHARTVPLDPRLAAAVERLLQAVGWQGLFQIDAFEDAGEPVVIDLNPRIYTSLSHATQAGMNLVAIWVDLLRGHTPSVPTTYRIGVRYRHEEGDARALLQLLRRGHIRAALGGMLPQRDTAMAVFSLADPLPFLTTLGRLTRRGRRPVAPAVPTPPLAPVAAVETADERPATAAEAEPEEAGVQPTLQSGMMGGSAGMAGGSGGMMGGSVLSSPLAGGPPVSDAGPSA
jgi:predicted ATP-grasp superfamily ATP-dependent carboligase